MTSSSTTASSLKRRAAVSRTSMSMSSMSRSSTSRSASIVAIAATVEDGSNILGMVWTFVCPMSLLSTVVTDVVGFVMLLFALELTEVCYLLEVSWQMCHAWITHWRIARTILTMSRRRSTHDERTHGRNAREPLLACT